MPKRLVKQTVMLRREGREVIPQIGKIFDFTDAELKSITRINPSAITTPPAKVEEDTSASTTKTAGAGENTDTSKGTKSTKGNKSTDDEI